MWIRENGGDNTTIVLLLLLCKKANSKFHYNVFHAFFKNLLVIQTTPYLLQEFVVVNTANVGNKGKIFFL